MRINILIIVFLSFLLSACPRPIKPPPTLNPALVDCEPYRPGFCRGETKKDFAVIKIKFQGGLLGESDDCTKVEPGTTLMFQIYSDVPVALNDAEVLPKNPANTWLTGTNNSSPNVILVDVPDPLAVGDYYYGIKIGDACLDPRVHVE